jgi:hypothetical protein
LHEGCQGRCFAEDRFPEMVLGPFIGNYYPYQGCVTICVNACFFRVRAFKVLLLRVPSHFENSNGNGYAINRTFPALSYGQQLPAQLLTQLKLSVTRRILIN